MADRHSLIPRISVTRPVTVTMCLIALLMIGVVAYQRTPIQLFPSGFTPPFLYLRIGLPNSTPQEVEQEVARPLEEMLRTIKGIETVRTYSGVWGVSAPLSFRQNTDMEIAYNQLMDRLERLKPQLPEEARDNIEVHKYNRDDDQPIMWIGLSMDSTVTDKKRFLETQVGRELERIDGVGRMDFWGVYGREVMIEVDQERLRSRGLSNFDLVRRLQTDNFALAGGYVRDGGRKFYVRSVARYESLEEIRNLLVSSGSGVRLGEVANVEHGVPVRDWYQRIDGEFAASMGVYRESGANIVQICDDVKRVLKDIEAEQTDVSLVFKPFWNQGAHVRDSIQNLRTTGLWGGLFAALVLLFFLRVIRMTLIITLAIPLCVMITLTALYFIGWSLNIMTMMGLMLGIGMVVDNAIVILENIYRMRAKGLGPEEASIQGASEVSLAITMATLTTVVVFLPLMLMSGDAWMTFIFTRLGMPIIVALVGSLFVALFFIPLAGARFSGGDVREDPRVIRGSRNLYGSALGWVLAHRRDTFLIVVILFATILYPNGRMMKSDSNRGGNDSIDLSLWGESHFTTQDMFEVVQELEQFLDEKREVYGVRSVRLYFGKTYVGGQVFMEKDQTEAWWYTAYKDARRKLNVPVDQRMTREEITEDLKKNLPKFVGMKSRVGWGRSGGGDPGMTVFLYGDETEVLATLVPEVERRLRGIPSVYNVDSDLERAREEVRIVLDREQAREFGFSPRMVGQTLSYAMRGVQLPRFHSDDGEVDTRIYLDESDRQTLQHLRSFPFKTASGQEIPLSAFASVTMGQGSQTIRRENGKTRLWIRAYTTKEDIQSLFSEIDRAMAEFELPRGYSWDKGERFQKFQESEDETSFALILAVTCVFLLMGVLFESFLLPFSVLFSIPLAFLGVYWTLYLTNTLMDELARIGVIVLVGVVVNNAIVLIDMVNRLRAEGMERVEAIIEAGSNRFRPILMTTFTTVFGLIPMAVGNSNMIGMPYAPLGRTLMGGLLSSTFLTLLVVPLFYTYLDDLGLFLRKLMSGVLPRMDAVPVEAGDD